MRIVVCDICGKRIEADQGRGCPPADPRGWFSLSYHVPIVDEKGNVVDFFYYDESNLCPECCRIANDALWTAFEPILKKRHQMTVLQVPEFPPKPMTRPDRMPVAYCNG